MITLYQFECSHFCEKARWALDYKGVSYKAKNLVAGPHQLITGKLAQKTCVPIIVDAGKTVQDSTAIINYLDQTYPDQPLTPLDENNAKEALEWEEYFDDEIGITIRLWFYYYALQNRNLATKFLLRGAPWYGRPLYAFIFPKLRSLMEDMMEISSENARKSEKRFVAACDSLNKELEDRQYLVGNSFSRADLTACALLQPLVFPDSDISTQLPQAVTEFRNGSLHDRFFTWVSEIYKTHRRTAEAV